jgi:hypothetical protein
MYIYIHIYMHIHVYVYTYIGAKSSNVFWAIGTAASLGNVLAILSLSCSVTYIAFIICRFVFFTYAILAGLHYTCRE